jgi:hypothetical protein
MLRMGKPDSSSPQGTVLSGIQMRDITQVTAIGFFTEGQMVMTQGMGDFETRRGCGHEQRRCEQRCQVSGCVIWRHPTLLVLPVVNPKKNKHDETTKTTIYPSGVSIVI